MRCAPTSYGTNGRDKAVVDYALVPADLLQLCPLAVEDIAVGDHAAVFLNTAADGQLGRATDGPAGAGAALAAAARPCACAAAAAAAAAPQVLGGSRAPTARRATV